MTLSNAGKPIASTGNVHHVYITCPDTRTLFSPSPSCFGVCSCVCVILSCMHSEFAWVFTVRVPVIMCVLIRFVFFHALYFCM